MRGFAVGGGAPDMHGFHQKNAARAGTRYYLPQGVGGALIGDQGTAADSMYITPLVFGRDVTIVRLGVYIAGARANSKIRLGIYDSTNATASPSGANTYPNALLVDSGELSGAVGGAVTAVVNCPCSVGSLYWAVYLAGDGGGGVPPIKAIDDWGTWAILGQTALNTFPCMGWNVAQAYGPLPNPCPTAGSSAFYFGRCPAPFFAFA